MIEDNRLDKKFDKRKEIWITVDIKNLPSIILNSLAEIATDEKILDVLADCPNISTRLQVAKNIHTSGETLKRLAKDRELSFIREEVASHQNAFDETLEDLSNDDDERVRCAVASNPKTPVNVLILKLFDPSLDVVIAAIQNPSTPEKNIEMLLDVKESLILHEVKKRLYQHKK